MSTSVATDPGSSSAAPAGSSTVENSRSPELRVALRSVRFPVVPGCATPLEEAQCVQLSCRYHLAHSDRGGRALSATRDCALTVANEGPRTLEEIAQILGMTRERVRQIEEAAIAKLQSKIALRKLHAQLE